MIERQNLAQLSLPTMAEEDQDVSFIEFLPFSDFRRVVPNESIYNEAFKAFPLVRLDQVKALSFLSYVGPNPKDQYFLEFNHTRLDHTLTVALIVEQILRRNAVSQEKINIGIVASLLHDIATPAYGDATKKVDPISLHEEDFWWQVLDKKGIDFIKKQGTTRQEIDDIIKNKGLLGKVLDIADRITYTMKDLYSLPIKPITLDNTNPYFSELVTIVAGNPNLGNIFKEVGVDQRKEEVFFNDPKSLKVFLRLRAYLHKNLYLHPNNQAKDLFVAKAIKALYSRGNDSLFSPEKLRAMTDYELLQILSNHYKQELSLSENIHLQLTNWHAEFEKFETEEEAKEKEKKLKQDKNVVIVGISRCKGFDPATNYKIADGYEYIEFRKYDPNAAREIEEVAEKTKGIFLFWADISKPSLTNNMLKSVLQK